MTRAELIKLSDEAAKALKDGGVEDALEKLRRVVQLDPEFPHFRYKLGIALLAAGASEEGFEQLFAACNSTQADKLFRRLFRQWTMSELLKKFPLEASVKLFFDAVDRSSMDMEEQVSVALALSNRCGPDLIFKYFPAAFGDNCAAIVASDSFANHRGLCSVTFSDSSFRVEVGPSFFGSEMLFRRLMAYCSYFSVACPRFNNAKFLICLEDRPAGDFLHLCFSGHTPNHILIPDSIFVERRGYASERSEFALRQRNFLDKAPIFYWRGALTGEAYNLTQVLRLPRTEICLMGKYIGYIDAKVARNGLGQYKGIEEQVRTLFEALDLLEDRSSEFDNLKFRYLVDIDGNTNSWPGLFIKLLSGGSVVKLRSPFRQWYYDKLIHGENVFWIDDLKSGIPEVNEFFSRSPVTAETIGANGACLARSITYDSEVEEFVNGVDRFTNQAFF